MTINIHNTNCTVCYEQFQRYEWSIRTIPGRFSTNYHVLFQMQTKNFEFRTKIMAGQIRKNGNLSFCFGF